MGLLEFFTSLRSNLQRKSLDIKLEYYMIYKTVMTWLLWNIEQDAVLQKQYGEDIQLLIPVVEGARQHILDYEGPLYPSVKAVEKQDVFAQTHVAAWMFIDKFCKEHGNLILNNFLMLSNAKYYEHISKNQLKMVVKDVRGKRKLANYLIAAILFGLENSSKDFEFDFADSLMMGE